MVHSSHCLAVGLMTRTEKRRYYLDLLRTAKVGYAFEKLIREFDATVLAVLLAPDLAVPIIDLEDIVVNGKKWKAHPASACAGSFCCFHNPSDHPLRDARLISRPDRAYVSESGVYMLLMERVCPHGIGHADPDSVRWLESIEPSAWGVHGCDGCCVGRKF